jgi:hypothetical protein
MQKPSRSWCRAGGDEGGRADCGDRYADLLAMKKPGQIVSHCRDFVKSEKNAPGWKEHRTHTADFAEWICEPHPRFGFTN